MNLKTKILIGIGISVGAIVGFTYYNFVGCAKGSCIITSKPLNSSVYGALIGGLLFSMFEKSKK